MWLVKFIYEVGDQKLRVNNHNYRNITNSNLDSLYIYIYIFNVVTLLIMPNQ